MADACPACGDHVDNRYDCPECELSLCVDCRLPEDHACEAIDTSPAVWDREELTVEEVNDVGLWRNPAKLLCYCVVLVPAFIGLALSLILVDGTRFEAIALVPGILFMGSGFGFVVTWCKTYTTLRKEPQLIAKTDAEWQPDGMAYFSAAFALSPIVVGASYLYTRNKEIGVPWDNLFGWL